MSFSIDPTGLPMLADYASAELYMKRIDPLRHGPDKGLRPIGIRKKKHMSIKSGLVGAGKSRRATIDCILYGNTVVRFISDGEIRIHGSQWGDLSTSTFISHILWKQGSAYCMDSKILWMPKNVERSRNQFVVPHKGLHLDADGIPTNAKPCVTHLVNRTGMTKVRKPYAEFIKYALALCAIKDHTVESKEVVGVFKQLITEGKVKFTNPDGDMAALDMLANNYNASLSDDALIAMVKSSKTMEDKSIWGLLTLAFMQRGGRLDYATYWKRHLGNQKSRGVGFFCSTAELKKTINELLKIMYWEECMTETVHPLGVYKKDRHKAIYNKYIVNKKLSKITPTRST